MATWNVADEVRHVLVRGRADDLLGRSELDDASVAHDRDAVAEPERLGEVVGDEHHRLARLLLQAADLVLHVAADERIERAERLVVEHHRRVSGERAGDADPLLHPAGELVRELIRRILEADELQNLGRSGKTLRLRHALDLEAEGDVVDHAPVGEQPEVLEHHGHLVPAKLTELRGSRCGHVTSRDLDLSRRRLDEADERADERRLTRSRETHDDEDLARPHLDRDVANRDDAAGLAAELTPRKKCVRRSDEATGVRPEHLPHPLGTNDRRARVVDSVLRRRGSCLGRLRHTRVADISLGLGDVYLAAVAEGSEVR